jgi:hypothetical protein
VVVGSRGCLTLDSMLRAKQSRVRVLLISEVLEKNLR